MPTKPNTTKKSIAYAYPTSTTANHFGMGATGCYFIQLETYNIEGSGQYRNGIHPQADSEAFLSPLDPDMQALFSEVEADMVSEESVRFHPDWYPWVVQA